MLESLIRELIMLAAWAITILAAVSVAIAGVVFLGVWLWVG